ncbi:hypothetical protein PVAP13_8KG327906 [Panicum virgatum]|uniref:Uncharacterized protein n=1 Tax=Panicum virgatum TaxID=38727 RepID=A0A8T0PSR2_PANVG|nr:hypothetical protein PVAP13_8KG327906 [Panicum virgatum]
MNSASGSCLSRTATPTRPVGCPPEVKVFAGYPWAMDLTRQHARHCNGATSVRFANSVLPTREQWRTGEERDSRGWRSFSVLSWQT